MLRRDSEIHPRSLASRTSRPRSSSSTWKGERSTIFGLGIYASSTHATWAYPRKSRRCSACCVHGEFGVHVRPLSARHVSVVLCADSHAKEEIGGSENSARVRQMRDRS